ncbi:alpha/beta fold hydrolase [Flavonifractor plautii]|jgi:2',3'-cyclic-nucleotide 2'-phosphodiesterase (5'-nucleotidase family)/dienelactone hydrolase|uniref:alpha/beta fold hydrolase n=1 Tax=Flavonifractor plautii TaxID=292800 RepID=UPI0010DB4396|nr:alpha/beta fold hydrolase [Flavonifractor plautii]MDR3860457.1 alpha/beta fold hydrolase [Flavonifractor sp.]MCB5780195.1 alpha/beta fold hydrolase [Flavonifractor plautii]MCQ5310930.1 alpha/beta fold hydrolase [Flavonifractor plautii]TCO97284.1 2',3'-cyclic-nucleotide 2'-phosphodiesterase (5'-nucleotidase family) [Flavonifractor plautii DSM 6740]UOX44096.1 alpha/beta fold hydrolase [Flavonifractor plautii]
MRKPASKFLSLFLVLAMVCSLFGAAFAAEEETATPYVIPDVDGKVVILHTNDTHGADLDEEGTSFGMAGVAQLKKDFEAAGADVLLVSAGDSIMGKPLVSADQGKSAIEFMNAAGYDAMTVGNHELDFGIDNLKALAKDADFPILCADMTTEADGKTVFDSNKIFEIGGVKVGVFGLATPETLTKADASKMPGITFPQTDKLYAVAQAQVDELNKAGADLIVCLGHLGIDDESIGNRSIDVCEHVNGIDLFIDGHSHSTTADIIAKVGDTNVVNGAKIVSTGTALANVGVVIYDQETGTLTDELVPAASYTKTDADVAKLVDDRNTAVDKVYGEKIATTEVDLNGSRSGGAATDPVTKAEMTFPEGEGVRTTETNLGDFAADAILWQARQTLGEENVDAALTNGGGIREALAKGDISKKSLLAVFPFGNTVATIDVTGAQLLEALEAATCTTPEAIGAFPQVSGIEFTLNTGVPYVNGTQYANSTYYAPANPGSRVTISTVNGEAFDPAATYTIATNDFTAKGGDTYGVFKIAGGWKDVGVSLEDALINYTTEELDGTITAEQYGEPAGRITIVDEPANYPADLETGSWYYNAAVYALDNGIMNGTNKGFEPTGTVTRATVYQTLYNMEGKPAVEKATVTGTEGEWYANAINWAASAGLFEGTEYGTDTVITRSGIATIIADYASYKGITVDTSGMAMKEAPDYDSIPAADLEGMTFCYYGKVMTGDQKGNLNPNGQLTRAEFAQVLKNFSVLKPTYVETVVSIPVAAQDGIPAHEIPATLTLPVSASKDAKVPGVVMLHGTGSNRDEAGMGYALAAPRMAADGIATLRIDFMGNGGSTASYRDYNYTSAVIDAKAAADYLAGLETVDGGNLGVMGWSQGGTDALLAAEAHPDTFQAVVTWSGALELNGASLFAGTSFEDAYAQAKKEGFYTMTFDWREPLELGERWFQEVAETNILKVTADIKAPILAINGKDDTTVTPDNAEKIVKAAANADSQLLLVDNCDHTYNVFSGDFTALYQTVDATAAFFQAQLIPAAAQAAA